MVAGVPVPSAHLVDDRARLETVLHTAVRGLGTLAVLLAPVLPGATAKLWTALGGTGTVGQQRIDLADEWTGSGVVTPLEAPLFPRIEQEPTPATAGRPGCRAPPGAAPSRR